MSLGNTVKLNIGGTVFQTTRSTLTKFDGFFKVMLETDVPLEKDENEAIFVDRDPKHFRFILNYMRDGFVNIPDSKSDIQEIQIEAQFYLLDDLVKLCNAQKSVSDKKNNLFPKSIEELTYAIVNSTKKAPYNTSGDFEDHYAVMMTPEIAMKYNANFDVIFFPNPRLWPDCRVFDVSTGHLSYVSRHKLDNFLKENYGVE